MRKKVIAALLLSAVMLANVVSVAAQVIPQSGTTTIVPNRLTVTWEDESRDDVTIDTFRFFGFNVAQLRTMVNVLDGSVANLADGTFQINQEGAPVGFQPITFNQATEINYIINTTPIRNHEGARVFPSQPGWVFLPQFEYNWASVRDVINSMGLELIDVEDDPAAGHTLVTVRRPEPPGRPPSGPAVNPPGRGQWRPGWWRDWTTTPPALTPLNVPDVLNRAGQAVEDAEEAADDASAIANAAYVRAEAILAEIVTLMNNVTTANALAVETTLNARYAELVAQDAELYEAYRDLRAQDAELLARRNEVEQTRIRVRQAFNRGEISRAQYEYHTAALDRMLVEIDEARDDIATAIDEIEEARERNAEARTAILAARLELAEEIVDALETELPVVIPSTTPTALFAVATTPSAVAVATNIAVDAEQVDELLDAAVRNAQGNVAILADAQALRVDFEARLTAIIAEGEAFLPGLSATEAVAFNAQLDRLRDLV